MLALNSVNSSVDSIDDFLCCCCEGNSRVGLLLLLAGNGHLFVVRFGVHQLGEDFA